MGIINIEDSNVNTINNGFDTEACVITYNAYELTYQDFFNRHMIKNVPCLIKSIPELQVVHNWIVDNKPNFKYLVQRFGDVIVPVADCGDRYYNAQKKDLQPMKQYLKYWESYISGGYSSDSPCLYLKDWHFTRDFPEENIYRVPNYFASDWLNEYFTNEANVNDDYRFVYMGPHQSWTPFHADVFSSYSWSVNLCGKKRWVLFPPGQEKCLIDNLGNLAYDVESPQLNDRKKFMNYNELKKPFEIIQNVGEAIFVPSGWHHQVWNLEDTISINHNWVNGCNIEKMWKSLKDNLEAVKKEILDCEDMEDWNDHCQIMLNATYGLDYKQFCNFLLYIIRVRLKHLKQNTNLMVYGNWIMGDNHLKFDIIQAKNVLMELALDEDFIKLKSYLELNKEIKPTLEEIDITIVMR